MFCFKCKLNKFAGFTLAEMLVIIGIIGIIASITISTLVKNFQEHALQVQFKKAYAYLNNIVQKTINDFGYMPECYFWLETPYPEATTCIAVDENGGCIQWGFPDGTPRPNDYGGKTSQCAEFRTKLKENLIIVKTCASDAYNNGCIGDIEGLDTIYLRNNPDKSEADAYAYSAGDTKFRKQNIRTAPAYVLSNGMTFFTSAGLEGNRFVFDTNGKSPPNKWGYDLFPFTLLGSPDGRWKLKGGSLLEAGGISASERILK